MQKRTVNRVYVIGTETIQGKNLGILFCILFFVFMKGSFHIRKNNEKLSLLSIQQLHSIELLSKIPFSLIFKEVLELLFLGMTESCRR